MEDEEDILEPMTIDDLAILIARSFAEQENLMKDLIDGLRDELNPRFSVLEQKVDGLRADFLASLSDSGKLKT